MRRISPIEFLLFHVIHCDGQINVYMHTVGRRWLVNVEIKEDRNFVMRSLHVTHPRGMPDAMYIILHFVEFSGQIYGAEIIAA